MRIVKEDLTGCGIITREHKNKKVVSLPYLIMDVSIKIENIKNRIETVVVWICRIEFFSAAEFY